MIQRIFDKIRHRLVLQVIRNRLAAIGIKVAPFYVYQSKLSDIKEIPAIKDDDLSAYEVNILGAEDIKYIGNNSRGYTETHFQKLLKNNNICIGIKHDHKVVAFIWFDLDECNYPPHRFRLKENEAYGFSLYTMESCRGKGIAAYLIYQGYQLLKSSRNIDTFYSVNEYYNSSSLNLKKKMHARRLKLILYIELFKKLQWKVTLKNYSITGHE